MRRAVLLCMLLLTLIEPAAAQFFGGGGKRYHQVSWGICVGANCTVGTNLTVPYVVVWPARFEKCFIAGKEGPTGAALVVNILRNGATVFGPAKLQIADGQTTGTTTTFSAASQMAEGDQLTIDIDQVGSTMPGKDVFVTCRVAPR